MEEVYHNWTERISFQQIISDSYAHNLIKYDRMAIKVPQTPYKGLLRNLILDRTLQSPIC